MIEAILFDCDGVLVDTEFCGHRVAFNRAFDSMGLDVNWDEDYYRDLLAVGGGKERMTHDFNQRGWPRSHKDRVVLVADLHKLKTDLFMGMIESGELVLRSGVARLIDEAITSGVQLAVCSTSNIRSVKAIVDNLLGPERAARMPVFAGDMVSKKKPDPAVYNLAAKQQGLTPGACVVIEDSEIGLRAAKAAGMHCVITESGYGSSNYADADLVVPELGKETDDARVDMDTLNSIVNRGPQ